MFQHTHVLFQHTHVLFQHIYVLANSIHSGFDATKALIVTTIGVAQLFDHPLKHFADAEEVLTQQDLAQLGFPNRVVFYDLDHVVQVVYGEGHKLHYAAKYLVIRANS